MARGERGDQRHGGYDARERRSSGLARDEHVIGGAEGPRIRSLREIAQHMEGHDRATADMSASIAELLSIEELADLASIFDLGRSRDSGEHYDAVIAQTTGRFRAMGMSEAVRYLTQKTNLLDGAGARRWPAADWREILTRKSSIRAATLAA